MEEKFVVLSHGGGGAGWCSTFCLGTKSGRVWRADVPLSRPAGRGQAAGLCGTSAVSVAYLRERIGNQTLSIC